MGAVGSALGGGLGVVGNVVGGIVESNAAGNAANQQMAGAERAANFQKGIFNQQNMNFQPFLQAGQGALPALSQMAGKTPQFTQQDFMNNMDPAYQFDLNQGLDAIQRSAAAKGGLNSGGTMKALNDYAQGQASNEYQNAYNRFMNNQNTQFSRLSSLAGMGQSAAGSLGDLGMNFGNMIGSDYTGAANAQAAGTMAQGQIWGNAINNIGKMGQGYGMMGASGGFGGMGGMSGMGGMPMAGQSSLSALGLV
jgi:hypothetical protein